MKRFWIAVMMVTLACVLAGCSSAPSNGASSGEQLSVSAASSESGSGTTEQDALSGSASAEQASSGGAIDYTTGTPWMASNIEGVVTEETEASIQDDFYLAVNKDDILSLKIPDGYRAIGTLDEPNLQLIDDLVKMLSTANPDSHDSQLACDCYELLLDWDTRNKLGVEPFKQAIEPIEAISSIDDLSSYLVNHPNSVFPDYADSDPQAASLWISANTVDLNNAEKYTILVNTPCLLMTDSAEYENETALGTSKREARSELASKVLVKSGYSEEQAAEKVKNCLDFEAKIAPSIYTNEQQYGPDYISLVNNPYTRSELEQAQGPVPITTVIDAMGYPKSDEYLVANPAYLEALSSLYVDENIELIKDFYIVHTAIDMAEILDRECYEWGYACSNEVWGTTGMLSDEEFAATYTSALLQWPTAILYVDTYLNKEDKDRISELTTDIIAEYHDILADADFLSEQTKANAIEKLEAIRPHILYPDNWDRYSSDELSFSPASDGGTLSEALNAMRDYYVLSGVEQYSKPVDPDLWIDTPTIVNCYYEPSVNGIFIMGAFTRCNVYRPDMSDEELYAKMGTVIAHEISHAFDSTGAQFDKNGNIANWWTDEDWAAFKEKNAKLEAYYNAMHPWEGQDFHGSIMTDEACADMAGMKCMLNIAAKEKDFNYDEFFKSYTSLWLRKITQPSALVSIEDVHPMGYLRVNATLQQFDEFLDCYDITEGDKMYLAPKDRVAIW